LGISSLMEEWTKVVAIFFISSLLKFILGCLIRSVKIQT
jgi:hypothetical protein